MYCGKGNARGEKFCAECGSPLQGTKQVQSLPQQEPVPGGIQCPYCGQVHPAGTAFCTNTGAYLSGAQPATPTAVRAKLILPDNREILLTEAARWLGRSDFDRVVAADDLGYISRRHLWIGLENGKYYVEDKDSANDTKLNGDEIKGKGKQELKDDDRIEIGKVATITFRMY